MKRSSDFPPVVKPGEQEDESKENTSKARERFNRYEKVKQELGKTTRPLTPTKEIK